VKHLKLSPDLLPDPPVRTGLWVQGEISTHCAPGFWLINITSRSIIYVSTELRAAVHSPCCSERQVKDQGPTGTRTTSTYTSSVHYSEHIQWITLITAQFYDKICVHQQKQESSSVQDVVWSVFSLYWSYDKHRLSVCGFIPQILISFMDPDLINLCQCV